MRNNLKLNTYDEMELIIEGAQRAASLRRTIRKFSEKTVDQKIINLAIGDALLAPAPHHTEPFRFIILRNDNIRHTEIRNKLLDEMRLAWISDLKEIDKKETDEVSSRISRGDIVRTAPVMILPIVNLDFGAHNYPDERRQNSERDMFMVAGGAAVENLMIRLSAEGLGSAWISSTIFTQEIVRKHFELSKGALALGAVVVGHPAEIARERSPKDVENYIISI
jgi:coenzyme F420-0:L-glutamate ligase / coenzyme F420-1:gamma-L-glutamate ligase